MTEKKEENRSYGLFKRDVASVSEERTRAATNPPEYSRLRAVQVHRVVRSVMELILIIYITILD